MAQTGFRYKNEIFTDAQLDMAPNLKYGTNLQWLLMTTFAADMADPVKQAQVGGEMVTLKTAIALKKPIPVKFYMPRTTPPTGSPGDSTIVKVTDLRMDAYMPKTTIDTAKKRPIIIYLHTGNYLPAGINKSPCGNKNDSLVVDMCKGFARRGFIAIAINYRGGWNPLAATVDGRRAGLLNAVYRSIHDVKECIRVIKSFEAQGNPYKMDFTKIALFGEGTGAYLANAFNTLDTTSKFLELPKFMGYIDTTRFGNIEGTRGIFNLYQASNVSTNITVTATLGGALADSSWLEAGHAPMIAMQCVRDPFAPFGYGMVKVPGQGLDVVEVDGANNTIMRAQRLGNNSKFATIPSNDPYTKKARSLYNTSVDYIYPAPNDKIMIRSGEGMYPFLLPKGATVDNNQASPWQWWDPNAPNSKVEVVTGVTTHMAGLASNPDMSKAKSKLYQDTIHGFATRRIAFAMGLLTASQLGITNTKVTGIKIYPNPATNSVSISYKDMINSVKIMDISGKIVYQSEVNNTNFTISSLNLRQGLYIVNVSTNQGNAVEKLIIN